MVNRKTFISLLVFFFVPSFTSIASDIYFDPAALERVRENTDTPVDLTKFEEQGVQPSGIYQVIVRVNNRSKGSHAIRFVENGKDLQPVLTPSQLSDWGVNVSRINSLVEAGNDFQLIKPLSRYIPGGKTKFEFDVMVLNISVPQLYMHRDRSLALEKNNWEDGIVAFFSNYSFSGASMSDRSDGRKSSSHFLRLDNGVNLGPWRLRNSATGSWNSSEGFNGKSYHTHQWRNNETVLIRDIYALRSRLAIGQSNTVSSVFDSVPFTGVRLSSEESMWPDNRRNFAPVIRGIAGNSAKISIKQNDSIIYQTWVPAGSFEIDDLPASGSNGDLLVTITEDSGKIQQFTVAYSSLAVLLREGDMKYSLNAGKYRLAGSNDEPNFGEASLSYGLPGRITAYGGGQIAEKYQSMALGFGWDAGLIGAFSTDVTLSRAGMHSANYKTGQSYRIQYAKNMLETGSTVTLAAYRYSTEDFYTLTEKVQENNKGEKEYSWGQRRKNRIQLNLNQRLPEGWGSLYFTGLVQDYWLKNGREVNLSTGYSNTFAGISYTLNYTRTQISYNKDDDHQFSMNLSVPLSRLLPSAWANYSFSTGSKGNTLHSAGFNGTSLDRDNLSYSINQSYQNRGVGNSGSLSLSYAGSYGDINGGYNYSRESNRIDYGIRGGLLMHSGGLTFSRALSGNMTPAALVRVLDIADIGIMNSVARTDRFGYTVIPYISEYRDNSIIVDTSSLPESVDISENIKQVSPSAGAIVLADFNAKKGHQALFRMETANKKAVPFGAIVSVKNGSNNTSIVGDNGEVYLSGLEPKGKIQVQWGNSEKCESDYNLGTKNINTGISTLTLLCR